MNISNQKVYFFGDSITEGWGASAPENCYVSLFKRKYPSAEILNYGIAGTCIAKNNHEPVIPRMDWDFNRRVPDLDENADLIVVFGGTNDFGHNSKLGELGDETEWTFYGALNILYRNLIEKFPKTKILVVTPMRREIENEPNEHGKILKDYVKAIKEMAENYALPILDMFSVCGITPKCPTNFKFMMNDATHPNDNGHRRLFEIMDAYISSRM